MKPQAVLILLFFSISPLITNGQGNKDQSHVFFTVSAGLSFSSAKGDIEEGMKASGLDETLDNWLFGGKTRYPKSENHPVYEFEIGYHLNEMHGISLGYGMHSHFEVSGYENTGIGNFVILNSRTRFASLSYYLSVKNNYHNFFAGPVMLFRSVRNDASNNISDPSNQTFMGLNLGYTGKIFNKKWWFTAVRAVYRWAPRQSIDSFSSSHQTGIITPDPETHTSTFRETKTGMGAFNLLLSAGLKLNYNH